MRDLLVILTSLLTAAYGPAGGPTFAYAADPSCQNASQAITSFSTRWTDANNGSPRAIASPTDVQSWMQNRLGQNNLLSPAGIEAMKRGENPYRSRIGREMLARVYGEQLQHFQGKPEQKAELEKAYREAIRLASEEEQKDWEKPRNDGTPPSEKELEDATKDLKEFLKSKAFKQCLLRGTTVYPLISEAVTALAIQSTRGSVRKWKDWKESAEDRYVQLQLVKNYIMGLSMGGLQCIPAEKFLPAKYQNSQTANLLVSYSTYVATGAIVSVLGQYFMCWANPTPETKVQCLNKNQIYLDAGMSAVVSFGKYRGTLQLADLLKSAALKQATKRGLSEALTKNVTWTTEQALQALSEYVGGVIYRNYQEELIRDGLLPK